MSLLHQVLQDIDQRQPAPAALPDAFLVSEAEPRGIIRWLIPLLLILVSGAIWFLWPAPEAAPQQVIPAAVAQSQTGQAEASHSAPAIAAATLAATPAVPTTPVVTHAVAPLAEPVRVDKTGQPVPSVSPAPVISEAVSSEPEHKAPTSDVSSLAISRVGDPARDDYLAALDALKNNQTGSALDAINRALLVEEKPSYLSLKLRVLLEQKNRQGFLDFYNQHAQEESVGWLAVAAPGLHMLGYPQLAVGPYQQLIVLQPGVVNWPLALAAAWEEQNKPVPARAVLLNILQHYRLSAEQQQWVQRRIEVLGG